MKGKGSYRKKFEDKNPDQALPWLPLVYASDEKRKEYEAGKLLLIDKPLHWTSFDVVKKIRNTLRIKKVGHAGTLDPLATGLLIVCTGAFTKKINEYMAREKEYTGAFILGAVTPTYDLESEPQDHRDITGIDKKKIEEAAAGFLGEIDQLPPVYSAIKKAGTPLYELARRGKEVEPVPRKITIHSLRITDVDLPVVRFEVICSTGTYIRSLAHDIGKALGCGAYLSELRRTRIGELSVDEAITMEQFLVEVQQPDVRKDS
jgi:tRNA pseudouridine55 synthase